MTRKARRWWLTTSRKKVSGYDWSIKPRLNKYIEKMKVLDVVDRKEASGSKLIRTKWVVTNKGTPEKPNVRARWVAQKYKWRDGADCEHYAPTPGLDLVKGVLTHAAAAEKSKDHVVAVVDVRRAYFFAQPLPKTFVELPDYFDIDTGTRCCGRLRRCLYGTRQAARSLQREIEEKGIKAAGMVIGGMSKCSFKSPCGKLVGVVHGDDILLLGPRSLVDAVRNSLRKRCEIREQMLGAGPKDASEIIMLNRRVQWTEASIRISPDPRHVKDIIEELGLEGAKLADTPMIVSQSSKKDSDSRALSMRDATLYRRLVAKLNFLAVDRPDVLYAASTMGSQASNPKDADMVRLKRVERFLIGRPIIWTHYRWEVRSDSIMAYTDSDWAANREDRRSVSGGLLVHNGGLLRFWSRRQKAVSLSSWESELFAAVSTGVEALGLPSGLRGFGNNTRVTIAWTTPHVRESGWRSTCTRDISACKQRGMKVVKIPTERSPADLLTKPLPFSRIEELCRLVGVKYDLGT